MFKGKKDKSVFITTKECEIRVLVHETKWYPDRVNVDRSYIYRECYMKSFTTAVGVCGLCKAKCDTVKVVIDKIIQQLVTAYPIHRLCKLKSVV